MSQRETERAERQIRQRAKQALRKQMRAVRAALPDSACDARSQAITRRILELDELEEASTVLAFASIRNEVRTRSLIDAMRVSGRRVALPRVVEGGLSLHLVESLDQLVDGAFSVPEPPETAPGIAPDEVEFALIPALAIDPRGYRIGYGGGYYDKLLPALSKACACAVAYDFQLIAEVPDLPFDVAVDLIVTDSRVIRTE